MADYINRNELLEDIEYYISHTNDEDTEHYAYKSCKRVIENMSAADVVLRGVLDQVRWERDTAIEQLKSYGVSLGENADVQKVKHGYNASHLHPVDEFVCSVCGFTCSDYSQVKYDEDGDYTYYCECEFDYCPKCGAKMDGERK